MGRKRIAAALLAASSFLVLAFFGWGLERAFDWLADQGALVTQLAPEDIGGGLAVMLLAAAAGVLFWPSPKRAGKFDALAAEVRETLQGIELARSGNAQTRAAALARSDATRVTLEKAGFATPVLSIADDPSRKMNWIQHYLFSIEPMLSAGHVREARECAERISSEIAELRKKPSPRIES